MTTELRIEKGIPAPDDGGRRRLRDTIKNMENGDSVFFNDLGKARSFYATMTKSYGLHATCRKIEGGYRVWKLEGDNHDKETS